MMLNNPFFSDQFDDGYYYHRPRPNQQTRRHAEEARRRAELERYYRMKELEEQERIRAQHKKEEYARHLRQQQMEEQKAYEEELRRRQRRAALLAEEERKERLRALRYLRGDFSSDEEDGGSFDNEEHDDDSYDEAGDSSPVEMEEEPVYRLMRGPDGRIYRVQMDTARKPKPPPTSTTARRTRLNPRVVEPQDKENRSPIVSPAPRPISNTKVANKPTVATENAAMEIEQESEPDAKIDLVPNKIKKNRFSVFGKKNKKNKKKKSGKKKRVTIIVEDASDSEAEEDYKSPWRNRRPSPGEWIEPVESFDR